MKINRFLTQASLFFSLMITASSYAETVYTVSPNKLEKISQNYFRDQEGRVIYYPCSMGGEPLVIYSSVDRQPIASKSVLNPIYLKSGYEASPILIPSFEKIDDTSNKNLVMQTSNPATAYVSFNLSRQDGAWFYVDTANFPIVDTISGEEGTKQKYVSLFNVQVNNSAKLFRAIDFPNYNYDFEESVGLFVYSYVKQIQANVASWDQNSNWTDGRLGRNFSNIPYRYSPIKVKDGSMSSYDGFGFWICGSDTKQDNKTAPNNQQSYTDKMR